MPGDGRGSRGGRAGARDLLGRKTTLRTSWPHDYRRGGLRRLRPSPDRGARDDRGRANSRARPRRGVLPAPPLLAHSDAGARVRPCARARRRRLRARRLPRARARRGPPGRERLARSGGRRERGRGAARPVDADDGRRRACAFRDPRRGRPPAYTRRRRRGSPCGTADRPVGERSPGANPSGVTLLGRLPRAIVVLPRALALGPHGRRRLVALLVVAAALGALYMFWLRDSSLVKVERVSITGLSATPDAARVREKLVAAAKHMTTLHVNPDALRRAVADEPTVHSLSVQPDFPHRLKVEIVENQAVALIVGPDRSVAVAPDGTVLAGSKVPSGLPAVRVSSMPVGARVPLGATRDRVAVAGAAPGRLLSRVDSISLERGRGAVAQLQDGPVVIFGRPVELRRKWAAAAAVLADRSSAGATYIDVRMPERPFAGGLGMQQDPQTQVQSGGVVPATVPPQTPSQTAVTPTTQQPAQATAAGTATLPQSQP